MKGKAMFQKIVAILILILAPVVTAYVVVLKKSLTNRFPDLEPKLLRKAYVKFLLGSATWKYGDLSNLSDQQMDVLFLREYNALARKA